MSETCKCGTNLGAMGKIDGQVHCRLCRDDVLVNQEWMKEILGIGFTDDVDRFCDYDEMDDDYVLCMSEQDHNKSIVMGLFRLRTAGLLLTPAQREAQKKLKKAGKRAIELLDDFARTYFCEDEDWEIIKQAQAALAAVSQEES